MPLWGTSITEKRPVYLNLERQSNVYQMPEGWVIRRPDGKEEVLVAIQSLATVEAGNASVAAAYFSSNTLSIANTTTGYVVVAWNEKVTSNGTATITITQAVTTVSGTSTTVAYTGITATQVGVARDNKISFAFANPKVTGAVLTILNSSNSTITVGGATIFDWVSYIYTSGTGTSYYAGIQTTSNTSIAASYTGYPQVICPAGMYFRANWKSNSTSVTITA